MVIAHDCISSYAPIIELDQRRPLCALLSGYSAIRSDVAALGLSSCSAQFFAYCVEVLYLKRFWILIQLAF